MNFLDIKQLQFIQKKDESLQLNYQQKEYHSIKLFYCFPLKEPKKYIAHVFDIQTNAGRKKITVLNIIWNIFENPDKTIMLRDSDENYYLIKDYLNHPDKHIKYLYNFL